MQPVVEFHLVILNRSELRDVEMAAESIRRVTDRGGDASTARAMAAILAAVDAEHRRRMTGSGPIVERIALPHDPDAGPQMVAQQRRRILAHALRRRDDQETPEDVRGFWAAVAAAVADATTDEDAEARDLARLTSSSTDTRWAA